MEVSEYSADFIVNNGVISGLKEIPILEKIHEPQILNYPKAPGFKMGMLVDLTPTKPQLKGFFHSQPKT